MNRYARALTMAMAITGGAIGPASADLYSSKQEGSAVKAASPAPSAPTDNERPLTPAEDMQRDPRMPMNRTEPDNTGRNQNDRVDDRTAGDQSNSKSDMAVTRDIRKALMNHKGLSSHARNIKIITAKGLISLRGPVQDEVERAVILDIASKYTGRNAIRDQLEIQGRLAPASSPQRK